MSTLNIPATGVDYFIPAQDPPAGTATDPQPNGKAIPTLFQPIIIRGVTFPNRIFVSPMCQYSAQDGHPSIWHTTHLGGIFTRGPGLTFVEATSVTPEGRTCPEDLGIWKQSQVDGLKKIVEFAHSQGQKIGLQLQHAGRKASTIAPWLGFMTATATDNGWPDDVWGPNTTPWAPTFPTPKALTVDGIARIVKAFGDGARRSVEAGFDAIEIHAAHGYLLNSFMSPISNDRTDQYGGSFENRVRILVEVIEAIRANIPESMPFFVRVSATDWLETSLPNEPSWKSEDTVKLAQYIIDRKLGVDLLDISTGGNHPMQTVTCIDRKIAYQAPFSHDVKKVVGDKLLVGAVGSVTTGKVAQEILDKGQADVVFAGRWFQKNPGLVLSFADDLDVDLIYSHQMEWGFKGRGTVKPKLQAYKPGTASNYSK